MGLIEGFLMGVGVFYSNGTGDCYNRTFFIYILRQGGGEIELSRYNN